MNTTDYIIDFRDADYPYVNGNDFYLNADLRFQSIFWSQGATSGPSYNSINIWDAFYTHKAQNQLLFKNFKLSVEATPNGQSIEANLNGQIYSVSPSLPRQLGFGFGAAYGIQAVLPQSLGSNVYFSKWSDGLLFDNTRTLIVAGENYANYTATYKTTSQYNNATLHSISYGITYNSETVYFGSNGYIPFNSSYLTTHNVNLEWWVKYDIGGEWFKTISPWFYVQGSTYDNFQAKCYLRDSTDTIAIWSNETHAIYNGPPPPPPNNCPSPFRGIAQIDQSNVNPCSSTLREDDSQNQQNAVSGFIKHKLEPFAPSMVVKFGIGQNSNATMKIFSGGTEIRTLFGEFFSKGKYATYWDGKNESGQMMPDGEYTFKLQIGNQEFTKNWKFVSLAGIEFPIQDPDMLLHYRNARYFAL